MDLHFSIPSWLPRGIAVVGTVAALTACTYATNAVQNDQQTTAQILAQLGNVEPVPVFDWSLRRSELIQIYQAQNKQVTTYSYVMSATGKVIASCPSLGWPIPGGTQLTNPQQVTGYNNTVAIGQAEPDGLYPPATSAGTYIMCVNSDGTISPMYAEPEVLTFAQPMQTDAQGTLVPVAGAKPSITIDPARPNSLQTKPAVVATPCPKKAC